MSSAVAGEKGGVVADLTEFSDPGRNAMLAAKAACLAAGGSAIAPAHLLQACAVTQPALVASTLEALGIKDTAAAAALAKTLTPWLELPPPASEKRKLATDALAIVDAARLLAAEHPTADDARITPVHLWAASCKAAATRPDWLLQHGWTRQQVDGLARAAEQQLPPRRAGGGLKLSEEHARILRTRCHRNLSELARMGRISPAWGMENTRLDLVRCLLRMDNRNVILTGRPGTGKTKLVEDLACRIAAGELPELAGCEVLELDLMTLASGTRYRGDMEERLAELLTVLRAHADHVILFIDEVHMVGSIRIDGEQATLSNVLKPFLVDSRVRVVGATTTEEFRRHVEKDQAFARRFSEVKVPEPDQAAMLRLLRARAPDYEAHHGVTYADESLQAIYDLTQRYLPNQAFPSKGVDLMDEVGVYVRMRSRTAVPADHRAEVTANDVAGTLGRVRGIAIGEPPVDLAALLSERVIGQDEAARALADAVIMSAARFGARAPKGPRATMLFLGPPGVGKSYMAEVLSDILSQGRKTMLVIDMAEFGGPNSGELAAATLLGSRPGLVGFDQGGLLTNHAIQYPNSVVLVDELDKAGPEARHVFLKILNDGWAHDNTGRIVSFQGNIFILTANAGREVWAHKVGPGFIDTHAASQHSAPIDPHALEKDIHAALEKDGFTPEFLSRVSQTVLFRNLDREVLLRIASACIAETQDAALVEEAAVLDCDPAQVAAWVVDHAGANADARGVAKTFERYVEMPLARWRWGRTGRPTPVVLRLHPEGHGLEISERTDDAARMRVQALLMARLAKAYGEDSAMQQQRLRGASARIVG